MLPFHCFMNPKGSCEQSVGQAGGLYRLWVCFSPAVHCLFWVPEQDREAVLPGTVQSRNFGLLQQKPEVWLQASRSQAAGVLAVAADVFVCMWKCRRLRKQPPQGNETLEKIILGRPTSSCHANQLSSLAVVRAGSLSLFSHGAQLPIWALQCGWSAQGLPACQTPLVSHQAVLHQQSCGDGCPAEPASFRWIPSILSPEVIIIRALLVINWKQTEVLAVCSERCLCALLGVKQQDASPVLKAPDL